MDEFNPNINYSELYKNTCIFARRANLIELCYKNNYIFEKNVINDVFCIACRNGQIEIAKWLYSLGNVNIHTCNEQPFRWACYNGKIETAQWLSCLCDYYYIEIKNNKIIRYSYKKLI